MSYQRPIPTVGTSLEGVVEVLDARARLSAWLARKPAGHVHAPVLRTLLKGV